MQKKLFGTDGIRGKTNAEPMTPETVQKVAMATAAVLRPSAKGHGVVIGKDTRLSGYMLQPALTSGLTSMGMDVIQVGPIPTPGIAMLVRSLRADLGIMITASHNPFYDNGIKVFNAEGHKLSRELEREIEEAAALNSLVRAAPEDLGRAKNLEDAQGRYIEFVKNTFPKGMRLSNLKIVVDCANGAAYKVTPTLLWELGAEVIPIGVAPNGLNINLEAGVMDMGPLCRKVLETGADVGIALDGDGDRVLMIDETGALIDGDKMLAIIAVNLKTKGLLDHGRVVSTVMSNYAFERYLIQQGITLERTNVGDRYVAEAMRMNGAKLGGEQSGHIILAEHLPTGDGTIAALQVLSILAEGTKSLSQICNVYTPMPQILRNVTVTDKRILDAVEIQQAISDGTADLGSKGRLLVRSSGTEPLIRIMVESDDTSLMDRVATTLEGVIGSFNSRS